MSNQVILWSMLVLPWLTLFFMKREEIKRFMPAALFTIIGTLLIADIGVTIHLWVIRENIYPLNLVMPFAISVFPVTTLWILKFLYKRFWLYSIIQLILSIGFAYFGFPWLNTRGILDFTGTSLVALLLTIPHFLSIYLYQMWQEGDLVPVMKNLWSPRLHAVEAKPFREPKDEEGKH